MHSKQVNVLIVGKNLPSSLLDRVETQFTTHHLWEAKDKSLILHEIGDKIDAILTSGVMGASGELIGSLPNLKIICSNGVGYDPIDINTAKSRGVIVTNTPDVLNDCVADLGMTLLLIAARRIGEAERYLRDGKWASQGRFAAGTKVGGKICGIVGLGNIGFSLAKRADAFGMDIHYCNPKRRDDVPYPWHNSIVDLASSADFLVLTLPGGKSTHHIINEDVLKALGPAGYLINIARGTVVETDALITALENHSIAGAALDVFEGEPSVPEALLHMENVVLTPHIASNTRETTQGMADLVFANLCAYAEGRPVLTRVA